MDHQHRRIVGFLALLLAVWIGVYWLYKPATSRITWGERPDDLLESPALAAVDPTVEPPPPVHQSAGPIRQAVQEPAFRAYTVQKGDTSFEAVARRFVTGGSVATFAEAISRANPLVTPDKLIVGRTRLRIPEDPSNTQGRLVSVNPDGTPVNALPGSANAPAPMSRIAELPKAAPTSQKAVQGEREYTVQPGDTLSAIAKKQYGRVALWPIIARANGMDEASRLKPGMKLRIPAEPKDE